MRHLVTLACSLACFLSAGAAEQGERGPGVPAFQVRPGYAVTLAADKLGEARMMEIDEHGTLYLTQAKAGKILSLREKDGLYQVVATVVADKPKVHGLHFSKGWLWFATSAAVYRFKPKPDGGAPAEIETVIPEGKLPKDGGHWYRPVLALDDGFLTALGDAGNIDVPDAERQRIWKFANDGGGKSEFVGGIRNTEKLRLRPGTQEVWGLDHGSDAFGISYGENGGKQPITDALPPCELNHYVAGGFYGHPFVVGNRIPRPEHAKRPDLLDLVAKTTVPAWCFGAHWAACGFCFVSGERFAGHKGDVFAAMHGSWNSSVKVGYRVERVLFDQVTGRPYGSQQVVGTLADNGAVLGRPVDCVEAPDGSVLFSCDSAQRIYRIAPARR